MDNKTHFNQMKNALKTPVEMNDVINNIYYWVSLLDFDSKTSHPNHAVVEHIAKNDLDKIEEAMKLITYYEKLGVKFDFQSHKTNI